MALSITRGTHPQLRPHLSCGLQTMHTKKAAKHDNDHRVMSSYEKRKALRTGEPANSGLSKMQLKMVSRYS